MGADVLDREYRTEWTTGTFRAEAPVSGPGTLGTVKDGLVGVVSGEKSLADTGTILVGLDGSKLGWLGWQDGLPRAGPPQATRNWDVRPSRGSTSRSEPLAAVAAGHYSSMDYSGRFGKNQGVN